MILYIIKTIACSAVFLILYKLLLEKAKMNDFKRLYLLLCSLLSFVLPALTFTVQPHQTAHYLPAVLYQGGAIIPPAITGLPITANNHFALAALTIYCLVSVALTVRFFRNIYLLYNDPGVDNIAAYDGIQVILSDKAVVPYSFWDRIFVPGREFSDGMIDDRIMRHEAAHVRQKHSFDIIFIELLRIAGWYNPVLYGYKRAIQLNHEFLADQSVMEQYPDRIDYQQLMLRHTKQSNRFQFSSSFNFLTTKKRLLMITQSTSLRAAVLKITVILPVIAGCFYLFPGRSYAQDERLLPATIITYHTNDGQKKSAIFIIGTRPPLSTKRVPTNQQLASWKNGRVFGVWVDGEKIRSESLSNYVNTDFSQAYVSKVRGKEKEYVSYQYMVDLMTNDYYKAHYDKIMADSGRSFISVRTLQPEEK